VRLFDAICGKKKILQEWKPSIVNHIWKCCRDCDGDADKLIDAYTSVYNHVQNKHKWKAAKGKLNGCKHSKISAEKSRKKKWLKQSTHPKELALLKKVIFDEKYLNDLRNACKFIHTGPVERVNNQALKYLPKYIHFSHRGMTARRALANLEQNLSIRTQSDVQAVEDVYNKKTGRRTLRKRYKKRSDAWRRDLHKEAMQAFSDFSNFVYKEDEIKELLYPIPTPRNISKQPRLTQEERMQKMRSRM
jgi:hypothetical protein